MQNNLMISCRWSWLSWKSYDNQNGKSNKRFDKDYRKEYDV